MDGFLDDTFRDVAVLSISANVLNLFKNGLFSVRGLPFDLFADHSHQMVCLFEGENAATEGRFFQKRIDGHSTPRWVYSMVVIGTVVFPFGTGIESA